MCAVETIIPVLCPPHSLHIEVRSNFNEAAPSKCPALPQLSYEGGEFLAQTHFQLQNVTGQLKSVNGITRRRHGSSQELTRQHRRKEPSSRCKESLVWTRW